MKIVINKKTWLLSFVIIFLPVSLILEFRFNVPYVSYIDEFITLIMLSYIACLCWYRRIEKKDFYILLVLIVFTIIGFLSNVTSELFDRLFYIMLDAFWQWKVFLCFIGAKYLSKYDYRGKLVPGLLPIAETLIVVCFICGIVSCFKDIGMTFGERYGIPAFYFLFGNHGRYGIIIAVSLLIVLLCETNIKRKKILIILAFVDMILSTKGIVYVIIPVYFLLWFIFERIDKSERIKPWMIVTIVIVGVAVSGYQIREYLLDGNSPRALLITHGFITANTYFPLGSGFGTYGSDVAARFYSPLYSAYGWSYKWSLGIENGSALNDNYLATIIGETGYFGLALYILALFMVYRQINAVKIGAQVKAMMMSLFVCMMVAFLATGITKSSIGVMVFVVLGVFVSDSERRFQ